MKAEFTEWSLKDLRSLDKVAQKQIIKKLKFYLSAPEPLNFAKKLIDPQDGDFRFRIGAYRVVFDINDNHLTILRIQHRRDVYRGR